MALEALNLYHHRELELSGSSLGRDKGLEAMRILLQFCTKASWVELIFFMMLDSVCRNLERRSISICRRSEVISEISFISSSRPFISPRIATCAYRKPNPG